MKTQWWVILIAGSMFVGPTASPIFLQEDVEKVPVERLLTNLQKQIAANPQDWQAHYALGRVHTMAYALKQQTLSVSQRTGKVSTGRQPEKGLPPSAVFPASTPELEAQARTHLNSAIVAYRKSLGLHPDHAEGHLGLGWALDQKGERTAAKQAYRNALALAWSKDEKADHFFYSSLTEEIARYLLALLDPKDEAAEIKEIESYVQAVRKKPRAVTPILVPLQGELTELHALVDPAAEVRFDLDGSGVQRPWGWITPQAGWLVFDHDGSGQIASGLQMAGRVMFWIFWENGYRALSSLDADGDGELIGAELDGLALWQDANSNGQSESGEVRPLSAWGITGLSCRFQTHPTGIPFSPAGVRLKDGTVRPSYDWVTVAIP